MKIHGDRVDLLVNGKDELLELFKGLKLLFGTLPVLQCGSVMRLDKECLIPHFHRPAVLLLDVELKSDLEDLFHL